MAKQRRKNGGRVTPKGTRSTPKRRTHGDGIVPGFTNDERLGLEAIFSKVVAGAQSDIDDSAAPVDVLRWASAVCGMWHGQELVGEDADEVFGGGLVAHAAGRGDAAGMCVLRALAAVMPEPFGRRAERGAQRLASAGVPEPAWAEQVAAPVHATGAVINEDPVDDDGVTVFVGFDGPAGPHTIGVYVDHNLGGIAKDAFVLLATLEELRSVTAKAPDAADLRVLPIDLAEAAARWREAFEITDMTLDPPITEDLKQTRTLALARLHALPPDGEVPEPAMLGEDERDGLVAEFTASPFAEELIAAGVDAEHAEELAHQILWYSSDYVRGTPLRFSPVMVEIFCCSFAPRKMALDEQSLAALPDVLRAWIRFAGDRRGIPTKRITEAVDAVRRWERELRATADDPASWGPAKTLVHAMAEHGVDLTDEAATAEFIDLVNRGEIDVRL